MVFLDVNLPDIDGVSLLSKLKMLKEDVIIVMITSVKDVGFIRNVIRLGAFDYVIKPIDIEDIEILLKKVEKNLII